ncbi:MAG: hypothetical protein R3C03_17155 [Pirellulaceae bacterium]
MGHTVLLELAGTSGASKYIPAIDKPLMESAPKGTVASLGANKNDMISVSQNVVGSTN